MHPPQRILFSGGGTLGPVTPLLALAERYRAIGVGEMLWIGTPTGPEEALVVESGIPFVSIESAKLPRYFDWQMLAAPWRLLKGIKQAAAHLELFRPDIVFTAGAYVSVPVVLAARARGIPVALHQQDARRGLANTIMWPLATIRTTVWARTGAVEVGNFTRLALNHADAARARTTYGLNAHEPLVVVLGGGTGAAALNSVVVASLPSLTKKAAVVHLTGKGKAIPVTSQHYTQLDFLGPEIADLFAAATLVVTRAGMGTLSELAVLQKPALVIPIPRSHQEDNVAWLLSKNAILTLPNDVTSDDFAATILTALDDPSRLASLGQALHGAIPNGIDQAMQLVANVLQSRTESL